MRRLLVVLGLLLAGCTATEPGSPTAGDQPGETNTTTTKAPTTTTTTGANRPKNIDMAAVDICKVFAGLPLATLGIDTDRPPLAGDSGVFPGSKDCSGNGLQSNLALILVAVADQSATDYVDGVTAKVDKVDVEGFQLYVLTPTDPNSCFGVIDVNDGQLLNINYGVASSSSQPVTPQAALCQRVPEIAKAALAQL
jgi:Protein of unknown function (DUF3558)